MLSGNHLIQKVKPTVGLLRAAASDIRLSILYMLVAGPMDLGSIVRRIKRSPSLIAHHLKVLHDAGWVSKSKFGRLVTYYLSESAVKKLKSFFM